MYRFSAPINEALGTLSFLMGAASLGIDPTSGGILFFSVFLTMRFFAVAKNLRKGISQEEIKEKDSLLIGIVLEMLPFAIVSTGVIMTLRASEANGFVTTLAAFVFGIVAYFAITFVKKYRAGK